MLRTFTFSLTLILFAGANFAAADQNASDIGVKLFGYDLCQGKQFCGIVYVAPWCPTCKQMMPTYRQYLLHDGRQPNHGFQVVVGAGKTARGNNLMAQNYGEGAMADNNGRIQRRLGINLYPSYLVFDSDRNVILRGNPARKWITQNFR